MLHFSKEELVLTQDTYMFPFVDRISAWDDTNMNFDISIEAENKDGYLVKFKKSENETFEEQVSFNVITNEFSFDLLLSRFAPFLEKERVIKIIILQRIDTSILRYEIKVKVQNYETTFFEEYCKNITFSDKKLFMRVVPGSKIEMSLNILFPFSFSQTKLSFQQLTFNGFIIKEEEKEFQLSNGFKTETIIIDIVEGARFLAIIGQDSCLGIGLNSFEYLDIGKHEVANLIEAWLPRYLKNEQYRRFISLLTLNLNNILFFLNNFSDLYSLEKFPFSIVKQVGDLLDFYIPPEISLSRKIIPIMLINTQIAGTTQQIDLIMSFLYPNRNYSIEIPENHIVNIYIEDTFDKKRDALAMRIFREFGAIHVDYNLLLTEARFIIGVSDILEVYTILR